jgi:hypothetical protein
MIGRWNIEITFANDEHRSVRFDAQGDGKGTLMPADPQSKVWGSDKPSEAKWSRGEGKSISFSGTGRRNTAHLKQSAPAVQVGDRVIGDQ